MGLPDYAAPRMTASEVAARQMPEGAVGDINSTAKGSGARYNAGKPPLELIPLGIIAESYNGLFEDGSRQEKARRCLMALGDWQERGDVGALHQALYALGVGDMKALWASCARVFKYGLGKYAPWNWAKGMQWSIPLACAARHCLEVMEGNFTDAESAEDHEGHIACNLVMLLTYTRTYPEGNDSPTVLA